MGIISLDEVPILQTMKFSEFLRILRYNMDQTHAKKETNVFKKIKYFHNILKKA